MSEPVWLEKPALLALHAASLTLFGGASGLRDEGLLDSALARPLNLHAYEDVQGVPRSAAAYASGIIRNHPFIDGTKRAAFAAAGIFLKANGLDLVAGPGMTTAAMIDLAAGELTELGFAAFLRDHVRVRDRSLS